MNFGERAKTTEGMTLIAAVDQGPRAPDYCAHGHLNLAIKLGYIERSLTSLAFAWYQAACEHSQHPQRATSTPHNFTKLRKPVKVSAG